MNRSNGRRFKYGDVVEMQGMRCIGDESDVAGVVRRIAKDGSWVDVFWFQGTGARWPKRQSDPGQLVRGNEHARLWMAVHLGIMGAVAEGWLEVVPA